MSKILTPKKTNKNIEVDGKSYTMIPEVLSKAMTYMLTTWRRLGKPRTVFSTNGEKMLKVIVATWQDIYPKESKQWIEERSTYQKNEKTLRQQVGSRSGRSLASIPMYIFKVMKVFFTEDPLKGMDREFYIKLAKKFPLFRMANKV